MGSWNGTCAVSKLPIHYGDNVICWFINTPVYDSEKESSATNFCNPNDRYELLGVPFRAKYNDYGSVEDIHEDDAEILNIIIDEIRVALIEVEQGENQYHDIEVKKDDLDFELITEAIHEGRLYIKGWGDKKCAVGMMMVHEHLLEEMIRTYEWREYVRNEEKSEYIYVMRKFDIDSIMERIAKAYDKDTSMKFRFDASMRRYIDKITCASSISYEFMEKNVPAYHPLLRKFIRGLAYNQVLDGFANVLRFSYGPQCGTGSQDGDQEPYHALIAAMQSTMKKARARFDGYDEDHEDE